MSDPTGGVGHKRRINLRRDSSDSDDPALKTTNESPIEDKQRSQSFLSPKYYAKNKHKEKSSKSQSVLSLSKGAPPKPHM